MKTYNLCISPLMRIFPLLILAVFTVVPPIVILRTMNAPPFLILPFLGISGWQWWILLTLVHRVVVHEDGSVEWVAMGRRVKTLPEDVREIGPDSSGSIGFFRVVHAGGKLRFINQITGFHEIVLHIKSRNPTVVLKGC